MDDGQLVPDLERWPHVRPRRSPHVRPHRRPRQPVRRGPGARHAEILGQPLAGAPRDGGRRRQSHRSPVSPCSTARFGKTQPGTGFRKAARPDASARPILPRLSRRRFLIGTRPAAENPFEERPTDTGVKRSNEGASFGGAHVGHEGLQAGPPCTDYRYRQYGGDPGALPKAYRVRLPIADVGRAGPNSEDNDPESDRAAMSRSGKGDKSSEKRDARHHNCARKTKA